MAGNSAGCFGKTQDLMLPWYFGYFEHGAQTSRGSIFGCGGGEGADVFNTTALAFALPALKVEKCFSSSLRQTGHSPKVS